MTTFATGAPQPEAGIAVLHSSQFLISSHIFLVLPPVFHLNPLTFANTTVTHNTLPIVSVEPLLSAGPLGERPSTQNFSLGRADQIWSQGLPCCCFVCPVCNGWPDPTCHSAFLTSVIWQLVSLSLVSIFSKFASPCSH